MISDKQYGRRSQNLTVSNYVAENKRQLISRAAVPHQTSLLTSFAWSVKVWRTKVQSDLSIEPFATSTDSMIPYPRSACNSPFQTSEPALTCPSAASNANRACAKPAPMIASLQARKIESEMYGQFTDRHEDDLQDKENCRVPTM